MNDNDVIKALEWCKDQGYCPECPYYTCEASCTIEYDALDLINRQQAEIERLNSLATAKDIIIKDIQKRYDTCFEEKSAIVQGMVYTINKAKSEARKEFAERLKSKGMETFDHSIVIYDSDIDNLLEEMEKESL